MRAPGESELCRCGHERVLHTNMLRTDEDGMCEHRSTCFCAKYRPAKRDCAHLRKVPAPGTRFGAWTLVEWRGMNARGQVWLARCACGIERVSALSNLKRGGRRCKTCGSAARVKSGKARLAGLRSVSAQFGNREAFARLRNDEESER